MDSQQCADHRVSRQSRDTRHSLQYSLEKRSIPYLMENGPAGSTAKTWQASWGPILKSAALYVRYGWKNLWAGHCRVAEEALLRKVRLKYWSVWVSSWSLNGKSSLHQWLRSARRGNFEIFTIFNKNYRLMVRLRLSFNYFNLQEIFQGTILVSRHFSREKCEKLVLGF